MSSNAAPLRLRDLIAQAAEIPGARSLHIAIGRPPMIRVEEEGLRLLSNDAPIIDGRTMTILLCGVVEPDQWEALEDAGEGEIKISRENAASLTMNVFRNSEAWSAVVHL